MKRNIIQDIKPSKRIIAKKAAKSSIAPKSAPVLKKPSVKFGKPAIAKPAGPKVALWSIVVFSILFLLFALSMLFSGAIVTITPKVEQTILDSAFTAKKNALASELTFEVMAIGGDETKEIISSETNDVEKRATGKVVIYNAYSSQSQKLLIDTRLETPNGKIYKTERPVTVPGAKITDGETIPGSVEVGVYADEPGEEYNTILTDFNIVGFKGTPKYEKFYARSKTKISGGLTGFMYTISEEEGINIQIALRDRLYQKLVQQARAQLPRGFVFYSDGIFLETTSMNNFVSETPSVSVTESGVMHIIIFDENELAQKIAEATLSQFDISQDISISNLHSLLFILEERENVDLRTVEEFKFNISGSPRIVWDIDKETIIEDLAGRKKSDFSIIMGGYTSVDSAEVIIRPFWNKAFSEDIEDIKIINIETDLE